ncbi:MAG: lamin tail domain-containing protein [Sedimentisphaerales bacterium]
MIRLIKLASLSLTLTAILAGLLHAKCPEGDLPDVQVFAGPWPAPPESFAHLKADDIINLYDFAILADQSNDEGIPLAINEFMASNSDCIQDPQGQYDDWIEIHNYGPDAINIGGMYLTDNLSVPTVWRIPANNAAATTIPAGSYLLIWADNDTTDSGLHANFKLDAKGEEIGLFDSDGVTMIDSIIFADQTADFSFGRYPDAGDNWQFFVSPSPAAQNYVEYLGEVADTEFSHNRGFYETPFSVTIATETKDATIYYTLDGTEPFDTAGRFVKGTAYTGPIPINTTTTVRAMAFKPGWKPTNMDAHTYIFLDDVIRQDGAGFPNTWGHAGADYEMDPDVVFDSAYRNRIEDDLKAVPTISLVMPVDDWFNRSSDPAIGGIYAHPAWEDQYREQAERSVSVEFFDPATSQQFQLQAGVRLAGGSSTQPWKMDKLSMRLKFTSQFGDTKLRFPVFGDQATDQFDTLVLDARMNNSWAYGGGVGVNRPGMGQRDLAQYTRDQYVCDIHNAMGGFSPEGRHVHLYLNGLYWGLYWLHERPDEHFAAAYFGGEDEDYDVLKHRQGQVINGSGTDYNRMFSLANSGLRTDEQYESIQQYLDVPNLIDYLITNYYVGNTDWAHQNWYATRSRVDPDSRWRYHSWDAEHSLEGLGDDVTRRNDNGGPTGLHYRLTDNAEYRMLFADHVHRHFFNNGCLTPEGATALYQIRLDDVDRAVVGESARWGDNHRSRPYTRNIEWIRERDWLLNEYFPQRNTIVLNQFKSRGWYPNVDAPFFGVNGGYQHGGLISAVDMLSMTATTGTIWYTLDGSDPRSSGTTQQATVLVPENADKRVLVPTGDISDDWKGGGAFDDSAWSSCTGSHGGVGFERTSGYQDFITLDLIEQMYAKNATCYVRIPFSIDADYTSLTLNVRYDDGFVAYINGVEVASRNFNGTPAWNSRASASHSDSAAVLLENIDISDYLDTLQQGENLLAIHAMNSSATSSDFLISAELLASGGDSDDSDSEGVMEYTGPITLPHSVQVKARVLYGDTWSALNEAVYAVGSVAENLRITEIMYNPPDPNEEFIELQNIGAETINLNLVSFTNGIDFTFPSIELTAGEHIVVVQNSSIFKARYGTNINIAGQYAGKLNNAGERIELADAIGMTILNFSYSDGWRSITDGEGFSLTIIDAANPDLNSWDEKDSWRPSAYAGGSPDSDDSGIIPEPGAVVINEVLAHSHAEASDWIELHNTTGTAIDIGGWFLSESNDNLFKYEIANGTTIGPNGYLVLYEDLNFGNANDPASHEPFALSENGERLYLSSAQNGDITGYRSTEDFGASETGVSFGRHYKPGTGNYNFVAMDENTPGSANAYPKVGPVVISEIMYNPDWPQGGSYTNDQYEFIELHNISAEPVTLYDYDKGEPWKFTDGIEFTFSADSPVTIPAGGYLLIVKKPEAFSWHYPAVPAGIILGPYDGNLSNAGESLELGMPGDVDKEGIRQYIRADRVNYSDGLHPEDCPGSIDLWPVEPDGNGLTLTRKVLSDYGNDPDNWQAASPTPASIQ